MWITAFLCIIIGACFIAWFVVDDGGPWKLIIGMIWLCVGICAGVVAPEPQSLAEANRDNQMCTKPVLDKLPLMVIPERSWLYNEGQWCRIR